MPWSSASSTCASGRQSLRTVSVPASSEAERNTNAPGAGAQAPSAMHKNILITLFQHRIKESVHAGLARQVLHARARRSPGQRWLDGARIRLAGEKRIDLARVFVRKQRTRGID